MKLVVNVPKICATLFQNLNFSQNFRTFISSSNRFCTCCTFSNVDLLSFGRLLHGRVLTSIHPTSNFHSGTCWIIMHPSPYTRTNDSYISSTVCLSAVRKRITLHKSDWLHPIPADCTCALVAPCLQPNISRSSQPSIATLEVCSQTQTLN